jgi:dinuclear metal center YbgI/SA1388 family protein
VLVRELQEVLERFAPAILAEPWDNVGLLVGDEDAAVRRVLATLELTEAVLEEALVTGCDTVLTHHPFLFSPVRTLVESRPRERLLRRLVAEHVTLLAYHTNLDCAPGGIADIAGLALGLQQMHPLEMAKAGWSKLVGFIPESAVDAVATAVFAAGGGGIGNYSQCAFAAEGTGWFTPLPGSSPAVGQISQPERTPEVRWETVVPRHRLAAAIRTFVEHHPYEEPAFDVYPVEDVLPGVGLGRVGTFPRAISVGELARLVAKVYELEEVSFSGHASRMVLRVGILPGSGHSWVDEAPGTCDVLITGDLSYHMAEQAAERGLALIDTSHGDLEWWAFRHWATSLGAELCEQGVALSLSRAWRNPWSNVYLGAPAENLAGGQTAASTSTNTDGGGMGSSLREGRVQVWIDGGSRGNPGPSAIGVVVEDAGGVVVETIGRVIEPGTNNVAEYQALLAGLEAAKRLGARVVEVVSDSELLVRQILGTYKVKNEGLRPLFEEARNRAAGFSSFSIRHVDRNQNVRADALVNRALDEQERAGL